MSLVLLKDITEDYSLGNIVSDCSEELLWRGGGGANIYITIFLAMKKHRQAHISVEDQCWSGRTDLSMILVLFYVWLVGIIPEVCISTV